MFIFKRDFFKLIIFIYIVNISQSLAKDKCDFTLATIQDFTRNPPEERGTIPAGFQTTEDIIKRNGFGYEKHRGTTEDGYIVTTHRIITNTTGGQPVLMQHGVTLSSDGWILTGRKTDLAFQLADAGYDVWLGDRRGNWYSREHVKYKPNSKEFWDFSFHESALYDLPTYIDGIINETKYPKVIFFGHSMSCAEILILTSLRPEYNDKIKVAILFGPVAITPPVNELKSPFVKAMLAFNDLGYAMNKQQGKYEMAPREKSLVETFRKCCNPSDGQRNCLFIFGLAFGDHRKNYNLTLLGDKLTHWPTGASIKTVYHLSQILKSEFAFFDYGSKGNLRRYHTTKPPMYPLEKITAPIAIYWGENDAFLNQKAVDALSSKLQNVVEIYKVEDPKYNHMDFIWGLNTHYLVNPRVFKLLERFKQ